MLSNVNADKDQVLQVFLVGQAGLRDLLRRPDLEQFAQRISVDYHLEPLNAQETRDYIRHRLTVAGGDPELFDEAASDAVFRNSGGVPRLINLLCDTTLVFGYAEQAKRIMPELVEEVAREKRKGGLFPEAMPQKPHDSAETVSSVDGTSSQSGANGETQTGEQKNLGTRRSPQRSASI